MEEYNNTDSRGAYEPPGVQTPVSYAAEQYDEQYDAHERKREYQGYGAPLSPASKDYPEHNEHLSTWAFLGVHFLLLIPFVGFILLVIWSFGGTKSKCLTNFARSRLIFAVITFIISVIMISFLVNKVQDYGFDRLDELENILEYYTA